MMPFFKTLLLIALAPAAGMLFSCSPDQQMDADKLERQLLIVWIATETDDPTVARAATAAALRNWNELRTAYLRVSPTAQERDVLRRIDLWMVGLRNAVDNAPAHRIISHLNQLHNNLGELRPQYGMDHPLDLLYAFSRQWDWVSEISQDQMMCLLEWGEYAVAYQQARNHWDRFQAIPPVYAAGTLPGRLSRSTTTEHAALRLTNALADFERQLAEANHGPMATSAAHVRTEFFHFLAAAVMYPAEVAAR
ncbi:hypothetical protein GGR26_003465 [Lewinella marina]|uniref:Uncharacterized protein n=1 Tax=Neolewinella marina TaxID=438751 RepID=A0A2G0CCD6_9BACT|nr:hypothetical protein [Neolewinella marina]NJB87681.1 hypothetical protein [Neolewinella marina]PHK97636.1 hypothetical protein CGL56_14480 [Neolewinella marina]